MDIKELSMEEKIGQKIIIGMNGVAIDSRIKTMIEKYKIGGIILYKRNFKNYSDMINLINQLKKINSKNKIPLFFAIDQEGGRVNRMPNEVTNLISARKIASLQDTELINEAGSVIGEMLRNSGFNMNFAPVLDIKRFEDGHAIGDRCYGENYEDVGKYGIEFMKGLKKSNVVSVVKHFPGHGATTKDSHFLLPVINKKISELEEDDILPFKIAIENGAEAIMVGHLLVNDVNKIYPCSLSSEFIIKILRRKYKFTGLIITDDLNMKAISFIYGPKLATMKAFEAGNDIIMFRFKENEEKQVINDLYKMVKNNKIKKSRIDDSVNRILKIKEKYELNDNEIIGGCDIENINNEIKKINSKYNK